MALAGRRWLAGLLALAVTAALATGLHLAAAQAATTTTPVWSTQLFFDNNGTAWSESFYAGLVADGLTTAEENMPWGTIEPSAGTFNFTEWDTELANAAAAGIKLVPIFWQAGWAGSPAPWINDFEEGTGGTASPAPDWWNPTEQSEYFTYIEDTIQNSIAQPGGYGGAILDYGWLDAQWDISPGNFNGAGGGYTTDDISEFQNTYLPQTYGTVAAFNARYGTSYTSFTQVPAQAPGGSLFGVFQAFRAWSVQTTYATLTADVRAFTTTPLFYYYGGGLFNATTYANNPDTFFQLAKQYNVTVIDDTAGDDGLTQTLSSLARAYGVPLMQEWTAPSDNTQLAAQAVQWISNYGMGLPDGGGEDFFIHDGSTKDTVGFPIYTGWLSSLKGLSGSYPQQSVAVYIDYSQGYGNTSGGSLSTVQSQIASLWQGFQAGFAVVTSQEVANGVVSLSQFKAILPLNGVDANLTSYQSGGGVLLTSTQQLAQYITPYATLNSSGILQTVPDVSSAKTSAQIVLADVSSSTAYNGPVQFNPAGLGLNAGSYHLVNAAGAAVPQTVQSNGSICATASVSAATLAEWIMASGAPPSGTASSGCPASDAPFGGTAAAVPGTVQAANYDTGGQGVAYSVTSVNGNANSYRSDGVNLETTSDTVDTTPAGGAYDLGWTAAGQWFKYTVNVATAGTYTVSLRLAAPSVVTDGLHIANSSGTNLTGNINVPATGGWQDWTTVTANVTLPAGVQTLTVDQDTAGWNIHYLGFAAASGGDQPFGGTPAAVPGTVYGANYDTGGQGVAYNVTSTNGSANSYRSDGVDLEATGDTLNNTGAGVDDLGWTAAGQWFKYTVNVATAGTYTVSLRLAAPSAVTDGLHIASSSGTNLSGNVNVPATGGWQTWTTVTANVTLPAGVQTLTIDQDTPGWNIHYLAFAAAGLTTSTWYEVVNENSGLCATAAGGATANGTAVEQEPCTAATDELWEFVPTSVSGHYEVLNDNAQSEGESWNIAGGTSATASGDLLQIWNYGGVGNTNALFSAAQGSSGYYTFAADNSGLCIDTPGSSTTAGVQLQQYTCNSTGAQEFSLVVG